MLMPFFSEEHIEAGCDEAGRGCLAGPVFAAAVILSKKFSNIHINDSKKLSHTKRIELRCIIEQEALGWAVARVEHFEIDEINILNASILAMHRAIDQLSIIPELLLIDGNRFKAYNSIPHQCIIKGDSKYASIAAASILAKTYRDDYMEELDKQFPHYNWAKNKGYPTEEHRLGIAKFGVSPHHRLTFNMNQQLKLF